MGRAEVRAAGEAVSGGAATQGQVAELPRGVGRRIALTHAGLVAERITRAFWPVWTVIFAALTPLIFGWQDALPLEATWAWLVLSVAALGWTTWRGIRAFRWPSRAEAAARVDETLPGRPLATLSDSQAIGATDDASRAVWAAHVERMRTRAASARAVPPDLRVSDRDPIGLRYIALLFFVAALLFGSIWRVGTVAEVASGGGGGPVLATGPVWEGWIEPPAYTGKPSLYLADIPPGPLAVPEGSRVTLRLYGDVGELTVTETVSGRTGEVDPASAEAQSFEVARNGRLAIDGPGGAAWEITVLPDEPPSVAVLEPPSAEADGQMSLPFTASDDYEVIGGQATFALDMEALDRRHGLAVEPEPREPIVVDLPMPFAGDRAEFEEALIDDFSKHPWSNLPVTVTLTVEDARGQVGTSEPMSIRLPGRRFFQPTAKAVIELRRDLLWSADNGRRTLMLLKAVSHRPEDLFRDDTAYLRLRFIVRRLDAMLEDGSFDAAARDEIAEALWELAILLEEGTLADALARLERAEERLAEAMRNGASPEEIEELMNELRDAIDDYTRMLAEQAPPPEGDGTDERDMGENSMEVTRDEIQALMDRIQELMEEGRMAEAQELMEQLSELMRNLEITRNQNGSSGEGFPGEQSMQDLQETLRDQQDLNDDSFSELQDQFNGQPGQQPQGGQQGQQPQGGQPGQQPGESGQSGEQPGQGQQDGQSGEGQGTGGNETTGGTGGDRAGDGQTLADRQNALRQELQRQLDALPNLGGEAADRAREALERAERAMEGAEEALEEGDLPGAIERQAEAMDALRDGVRNLGEALAQERELQDPGQGTAEAEGARPEPGRRDPLGREMGNAGQLGSEDNMLQGEDIYRRAEELLRELRDRSADRERPQEERDYLERLLDRF